MDVNRFLKAKGVMSIRETISIETVQQWLTEFAEQYYSEKACAEKLGEVVLSICPKTGTTCGVCKEYCEAR